MRESRSREELKSGSPEEADLAAFPSSLLLLPPAYARLPPLNPPRLSPWLLLQKIQARSFTVWDPITSAREEFRDPSVLSRSFSIVVLYAATGCDCHGDPFLIV